MKVASPVLNGGDEETCPQGNAPCPYPTGKAVVEGWGARELRAFSSLTLHRFTRSVQAKVKKGDIMHRGWFFLAALVFVGAFVGLIRAAEDNNYQVTIL